MSRLTKNEIRAIVDILNERLAGGVDDLGDALGMEDDEAERVMQYAESALGKLGQRLAGAERGKERG
jgi:hypothetical protein